MDKRIECERNYSIVFHKDPLRGHFERDGEAIGGLWFERMTDQTLALSDYDGTTSLPRPVLDGLRDNGYIVTPDFE